MLIHPKWLSLQIELGSREIVTEHQDDPLSFNERVVDQTGASEVATSLIAIEQAICQDEIEKYTSILYTSQITYKKYFRC